MRLNRDLILIGALALLALVYQCQCAPAIYSSVDDVPDSEESYETVERVQSRDSRFLKGLFVPPSPAVVPHYYSNPYYYRYGGPSYYNYQPVFKYRQARKKRKRLFVPNFWG